jgi:TolB-like protein
MRKIFLSLLIPSLTFGAPAEAKGEIYKKLHGGVTKMITDFRGTARKTAEGESNALFVAVVDFEDVGPDAKKLELGAGIAEMVSAQAGKVGPDVKVVDRKRMKTIMKELALSEAGVVDGAAAKQTGRILAADMILSASVTRLGNSVSVTMRLVNVETAHQVSAITVELPAAQIVPMAQAASIEDRFPATAAFRSLSVPGWGHFYNNQFHRDDRQCHRSREEV